MGIDITSILGGSLADAVSGIIGHFKADPTVVAQAQAAAAANQAALQEKQLDLQAKLDEAVSNEVTAAAANIQAEAKSGDKYTSRARPTFMYIVEAVLAFNYIVIPLVHLFGRSVAPFALPDNVMYLFGVSITGYTAFRSFDKFMALPGDSSVKLGSVQVGNKS